MATAGTGNTVLSNSIFSNRGSMSLRETLRWFRQWVPFGARTIWYGTISLLFGPFTRERRASLWAMRKWSIGSARGLGVRWEIDGLDNPTAEALAVWIYDHLALLLADLAAVEVRETCTAGVVYRGS